MVILLRLDPGVQEINKTLARGIEYLFRELSISSIQLRVNP